MLKLDLTFSLTLRPPSPGEPIPVFCALFRNMLAYASMYESISYTIFFFFMWMVLEHCFHYGRLFHITTLYSYHVTLPAKFHLVKAIVFPVVMYRCESWTIKKANCQRINAFESWCWRRLFLRVPWTAGRSNQSVLREINPEYSLEELMPKLKLQYFGHLMQRANSLKKTLILGRIDGNRKRRQQRMRRLDSITDSMDMNLSKL